MKIVSESVSSSFADAQSSKPGMLIKSLSYISPKFGEAILVTPPLAVLGGIYAKYYGLSLTAIATVILVARMFDAVTDPIIGCYSDRRRARTGTRKPLILFGAIAFSFCSYFLFIPPDGVGVTYFAFWYLAYYFTLTIFYIPFLAWAAEFTDTSKDKTLVFSLMAAAGQGGVALFYLVPLLPFFATNEVTPETLRAATFFGIGLFLAGTFIALRVVPDSQVPISTGSKRGDIPGLSLPQQVISIWLLFVNNRPFVVIVLAYACFGIGAGMWSGLLFIYVDTYLHMGTEFAKLSLWGTVSALLSVLIWYRVLLYWGNRNGWLVCALLLALAFLCTAVLRPVSSGYQALLALNILATVSLTGIGISTYPILCDAIQYGRLKDDVERTALYFSVQILMTKFQAAIGVALGFFIVGWFGFDVQEIERSDLSIIGLRIGISWAPTFFVLLAVVFMVLMPLNGHKMEIVRRRLKSRELRTGSLSPSSCYDSAVNVPPVEKHLV